jgi:hypothetical protein
MLLQSRKFITKAVTNPLDYSAPMNVNRHGSPNLSRMFSTNSPAQFHPNPNAFAVHSAPPSSTKSNNTNNSKPSTAKSTNEANNNNANSSDYDELLEVGHMTEDAEAMMDRKDWAGA